MSQLSADLAEIARQEKELADRKRDVIATAPRTFEYRPAMSGYRYFIVRADGKLLTSQGQTYFVQRPTAEEKARWYAKQYSGNIFLYDSREGTIKDSAGEIVARDAQ